MEEIELLNQIQNLLEPFKKDEHKETKKDSEILQDLIKNPNVLFDEQQDAKEGFPKFREYIGSLSFKQRTVLFLNTTGSYSYDKTKIIFESFTPRQQDIFNDNYADIDTTVRKVYSKIIKILNSIQHHCNELEKTIRDIFIFESNTEWTNEIIKDIKEYIPESKDVPSLLLLLHRLETYVSPYKLIKVEINKETGLYKVDSSYFDYKIKMAYDCIRDDFAICKAYLICIRSFLESIGKNKLLPHYVKDVERILLSFGISNEEFSSKEGNRIRKIPKKKRSEQDVSLLEKIEFNEKRGFAFPDYTTVEPNEHMIKNNICFTIYEETKNEYE